MQVWSLLNLSPMWDCARNCTVRCPIIIKLIWRFRVVDGGILKNPQLRFGMRVRFKGHLPLFAVPVAWPHSTDDSARHHAIHKWLRNSDVHRMFSNFAAEPMILTIIYYVLIVRWNIFILSTRPRRKKKRLLYS